MGEFFKRSGAVDFSVPGPILPNFEPIRDHIVVLATCKNKEEPIENEEARVAIITLWELPFAMENRVLMRSGPKLNIAWRLRTKIVLFWIQA